MPYLLQTERLTLRPFDHNDFTFMRSLHLDEKMMEHIGAGIVRTEEQSLAALSRILDIEKEDNRLGAWIVELKPELLSIGLLIIRPPASKTHREGLEIGYSIITEHWGEGYAQEAVRTMINYTYDLFGPSS